MKEIQLYSNIFEVSKKESEFLKDANSINRIFELMTYKYKLIHEVNKVDDSIKEFKNEWSVYKKNHFSLPKDIVNLLKRIEDILYDIIIIDGKNKAMIDKYFNDPYNIYSSPKNIESDTKARAMKAYSYVA